MVSAARRKITKFGSLFTRKSDGLFGLTQHFPNIKNVYIYIQRGYDDSQILIVCSPFPVPKTICFSTPFTKLLAWYPEESRSHFEESFNQYLEFMR